MSVCHVITADPGGRCCKDNAFNTNNSELLIVANIRNWTLYLWHKYLDYGHPRVNIYMFVMGQCCFKNFLNPICVLPNSCRLECNSVGDNLARESIPSNMWENTAKSKYVYHY